MAKEILINLFDNGISPVGSLGGHCKAEASTIIQALNNKHLGNHIDKTEVFYYAEYTEKGSRYINVEFDGWTGETHNDATFTSKIYQAEEELGSPPEKNQYKNSTKFKKY